MNILHVNLSDSGGAGLACLTLHRRLLEIGYNSKMLVFSNYKKDETEIYQFDDEFPDTDIFSTIKKGMNFYRSKMLLKGRKKGFEIFTFPWSARDITRHSAYKTADIVHLHWSHILLDYPSFFRKIDKPVVLTTHDFGHFTGGCHISEDCRGFMELCTDCPQLAGTILPGQASRNLSLFQKAYDKTKNLAVISPANWVMKLSQQSIPLKNKQHYFIRNGINLNIFSPLDKAESRRVLGVSSDILTIATAALNLASPSKGLRYLIEALRNLKSDYQLLAVGDGGDFPEDIRRKTISLGKINHAPLLSAVYSAADLTAIPSRIDVGPQTLQESMACATPVVAFDNTGPKELINNMDNGYLAKSFDINDFADGIINVYENMETYGKNALAHAKKEFDINNQAEKVINLYNKMI